MRKIIVTEFITLDGVVEAPGGNETPHPHGGWQTKFGHPEGGKYKIDELAAVDALLLGRTTYEVFAGYWPGQDGNGFGDRMNQLPKYVVSRSLKKADWNNTRILRGVKGGDVAARGVAGGGVAGDADAGDVASLKKTDGGDILVYGSATLVKALLHHDLIDELHLMVYPVCVGGGLRLFEDNRELKKFGLRQSRALDNGVIILEYQLTS